MATRAAENYRRAKRAYYKIRYGGMTYRREIFSGLVYSLFKSRRVASIDLATLKLRDVVQVRTTSNAYILAAWQPVQIESCVSVHEYVTGIDVHYQNGIREVISGIPKSGEILGANTRVLRELVVGRQLVFGDDIPAGIITSIATIITR